MIPDQDSEGLDLRLMYAVMGWSERACPRVDPEALEHSPGRQVDS